MAQGDLELISYIFRSKLNRDSPLLGWDNFSLWREYYFTIILLIFVFNPTMISVAVAGVELCNKAKIPLWTSIGYRENSEWKAEGWWKIWPNDCAEVTKGPVVNRYYYYRAESAFDFWTWGGGEDSAKFCADSNAYKLTDRNTCADERVFSIIDTGKYVKDKYTLNIKCNSCELPKYRYLESRKRIDVYHVHRERVFNQYITVPIKSVFYPKLNNEQKIVEGTFTISVDLGEFQKKAYKILTKTMTLDEECGNRFKPRSLNIVALPNGSAEIKLRARYARWLCTSMDVPETKCVDKRVCVNKPPETVCDMKMKCFLGACTKVPDCRMRGGGKACTNVPSCTTKMKTRRTSKNVLLETGGTLSLSLKGSVRSNRYIRFSPRVTAVRLDGFAQNVIDILGINLKRRAQDAVSTIFSADMLTVSMPPEIKGYTKLESVKFVGSGANNLELEVTGVFSVDGPGLISFCRKFWPQGKCQRLR